MKSLRIHPVDGALRGASSVPGDKSIGHRALLLSAIASGTSTVRGLSDGEDNRRTLTAVAAMGVRVERAGAGALRLFGVGLDGLAAAAAPIDCGNSGTTLRLLAGLLSSRPFATTLDGDASLRVRPMGRVAVPLQAMGAALRGEPPPPGARQPRPGELYPPLRVGPASGALRGIDYRSPIASAQVKSAILLAGLCAEGVTRFHEPAASRDHTERMLAAMGAPLSVETLAGGELQVTLDPRGWERTLAPREVVVPGDLSSAAFLLGAAALAPGSEVLVRGVGMNPTRTGVLDVLSAMGVTVDEEAARQEGGEPVADLRVRGGALRGALIEGPLALRALDELPLCAALAAHAEGETVIRGAAELRVKESDRIAAMVAALRALGVEASELPDGMVIQGGAVRGGRVDSHTDHRIAMASAVCALRAGGDTTIDDCDNVATSFPGFAATLSALGADVREEPGAP